MGHACSSVPCFAKCAEQVNAALFVDGASTMQQFMWQQNLIGVGYFVQNCFDPLDALV